MNRSFFKNIFILLIFGSSMVVADSIQEQLDSIILIDESNKSNMKQRTVVGCDNTLEIAEVKCSKKRDSDKPLVKKETLPKSDKKDNSKDIEKDIEMEEIKSQLNDILQQLSELKKVKENNIELREQLKKVTLIQKLVNKDDNNRGRTKEIKVLKINGDHVIVKVQDGESLSKYAQKYYGDSRKYHNIRRANPTKIDDTLQIYIDDELIIPTSISFKYKEETKEDNSVIEEIVIPLDNNEKSIVEEIVFIEDDKISLEPKKRTTIIKVEKGVDIFQLAVIYYGDEKEYYHIYNANKDSIDGDLKLENGMELEIPSIK